jgi:hypothetical protein
MKDSMHLQAHRTICRSVACQHNNDALNNNIWCLLYSSEVSIVIGYGLDGGLGVRIPVGSRIFTCP